MDIYTGIYTLSHTILGKKEDNLDEAIVDFKYILDNEEEKGDWGFKALKQRV